MRTMLTDMMTPVLSAVSKPFLVTAEFIGGVSGISELRAENARLEAENVRLRDWYQTALMLQSENHSLRELLNLELDPAHKYVSTRVIADTGNAYVHSVLVAQGTNAGIQKGQAVLAEEGMIGRIIETGKNSARVLLLTDFNSRVPVLIEGSRQRAILAGNNDTLPLLKHLPPDGEVAEGMRIVTSGHGGIFPPGLPIGRIVKTDNGQYAVKPFADMGRVTYVRVVDAHLDTNLRHGVLDSNTAP